MSDNMELVLKWYESNRVHCLNLLKGGFFFSKNKHLEDVVLGKANMTEDDAHSLAIKYYSIYNRLPRQDKRTVHVCSNVVCPPQLQAGYDALKRELQNGDNLLPRMSRSVKDLDAIDGMFNDWGIQHFHLGTTPDAKHPGMLQGADDIAYVYLDGFDAYIITIDKHGKWAENKLLEELLKDFPHVLDDWRLKGVTSLSMNPDGKDRELLRKYHINSLVEINGACYCKPLGGEAGDGSNMWAVITTVRIRNALRRACGIVKQAVKSYGWSDEDYDKSLLLSYYFSKDWFVHLQKPTGESIVVGTAGVNACSSLGLKGQALG